MPTLVIRLPDGSSQEHELSGEATIGRADGNDLVLTEGGVSRRHARFFVDGGGVLVEDLGSANGTYVDGARITEPTPVGPRAQVVIGDYEVSLKAAARRASGPRPSTGAPAAKRPSGARPAGGPGGNDPTGAVPAVRPARATRQMSPVKKDGAEAGAALAKRPARSAAGAITGPTLRGLTGPWANKLYPIRGTVTVGRVAGVQIQLEDESVSRRHAEVERIDTGVVVRDLGSANGTLVNGTPVEGDVELQAGDVVQFGMIELSYELGDEEALAAPTRRGGASRPAAARRGPAPAGAAAGGSKKKLLVIGGAALGLLLVGGIVVKASSGGGAEDPGTGTGPMGNKAPPIDPRAEVESLLSECRTYASAELGQEPNWAKARAACDKARALDPINASVLQLIQKIDVEQECGKHYEAGKRLMNLLREQEAIEEFGKIKRECSYYRIVKPKAREAIESVKKKTGRDCKEYASRGNWEQALPRCEAYMTFACQNMSEEDLHAPPGFTVDLTGKCRRDCWRPKDAMYLSLLKARAKADPNAGPWMCPPMPLFEDELVLADPRKEVEKIFKEKFKEPLIRDAMQLYWEGKGPEAVVKLHKLRAQTAKAEFHQQADELRLDIDAVTNLFKVGSGFLGEGDVERASENFQEVLKLDEKLLADLAKTKPGFYRRSIESGMADASYTSGKTWADRGDFRKACKLWKLGFSYFRGQPDLNKAVGVCSNKGALALKGAGSCDDLKIVLDYAVDGDGLKEKASAQGQEWQCGG